ncbi:hypothetical protein O7A70_33210 [Mesorhizobium sp. Cs1299R1N1]
MKEAARTEEVVVVSVGSAKVEEKLRKALALAAVRAMLVEN